MSDVGLDAKESRLRHVLRELGSCAIGFSGGVDSSLLLAVAAQELGDRALGVLAVSPSLPESESEEATQTAREIGARLRIVHTRETEDPRYQANDGRRCYYCKSELWEQVWAVAREEGLAHVCEGTIVEDAQDYRPGLKAAREQRVQAPLKDAGFTKADVRALAAKLGVPTSSKPSSPCLSSRVPHGMVVSLDKLRQIGEAERHLRELGFADCRVRHFGETAVVAVPKSDLPRLVEQREAIVARLRELGFLFVTADLEGLVSGSLNRLLKVRHHGS